MKEFGDLLRIVTRFAVTNYAISISEDHWWRLMFNVFNPELFHVLKKAINLFWHQLCFVFFRYLRHGCIARNSETYSR